MFVRQSILGVLGIAILASGSVSTARAESQPCMDTPVMPAPIGGLPDRVQRLEDNVAIQELKTNYINMIDAVVADPSKVDDLIALLTEDACIDYGPLGRFHGKPAVKSFFQKVVPQLASWDFHVASQPQISINGNVARGLWKVIAHGVAKPPGPAVTLTYARYKDRYERTASGWKIRTIILIFDSPPTVRAPGGG